MTPPHRQEYYISPFPAHVYKRWNKRVNKNGLVAYSHLTPCWLWTGPKNNKGYGYFSIGRAGEPRECGLAHRAAYLLFRGVIPDHLCVLHHCDNPSCVNPDHLFLGTRADNNTDSLSKGRHLIGEQSHHAKLTTMNVLDIRRRRDAGESRHVLAAEFGVTAVHIWKITKRQKWKQLAR